ncbi:uncharacterized protein Dvar_64890 [Desulfosarcina variabilis str. Montpellier]|uniref:hypothetical protein n=1 Tax=Desulfosarcina variabilis TaxID=2300 RepID=UPI003AFAD1D4
MKWKFWEKDRGVDVLPAGSPPGPLPPPLSAHLVEKLKLGCDWVRSLECVSRAVQGQRHLVAFRIYSPSRARRLGVVVSDYDTLDGFAHLILFSGTIDNQSGRIELIPEQCCPRDPNKATGLRGSP